MKRRNPTDATHRNTRAAAKRDAALRQRLKAIEARCAVLEEDVAVMGRVVWAKNKKR